MALSTGTEENIKKVADSIGYIYYYDAQRDEYMHPAAITLLSSEGKISRYLYGIEYPVKDLKLGILEASEGKIGSTLIRLFCIVITMIHTKILIQFLLPILCV